MHTEGLPIKLLKGQIVNFMLLLLWKSGDRQQQVREREGRWRERKCMRGDLSQGCWAQALPSTRCSSAPSHGIASLQLSFLTCRKSFLRFGEHSLCTCTHRSKWPFTLPASWNPIHCHQRALGLHRQELALPGLTAAWGSVLPEMGRSRKQHRNVEYYYSLKHCL